MKNKILHIIFITLITSINLFSQSKFQSKAGYFDFSNANLTKKYTLTGQWQFYWKKLYTPEDFKQKDILPSTIEVNSVWNKINKYPADGYATYRVFIIVPKAGNYTIKFHQVLSAYKVYINGKLKDEVGIVDSITDKYKAIVRTNSIPFYTDKDTNEIIVQVANYSHRLGGIQEKVEFGKTNIVERSTYYNLILLILTTGAEFIFALYFFFSFFFRQKDPSYIFFSIAILITITFGLVNNEMVLLQFFPNLSFEAQKKIDFFTNYSRLTFFTLFLWFTFKEFKIFSKKVFYTILILSSALSLFVLFTKCKVYSYTLIPFEILSLLSFLYFLFISLYGLIKKVPYIIYTFIGLLILNTGIINDILTSINLINTPYTSNYALLIFFIGHSISLSLIYSSSTQQVSILTSNFKTYEQILQEIIQIYTYDLESLLDKIKIKLSISSIRLFTLIDGQKKCECIEQNSKVYCSKGLKSFDIDIDDKIVDKIVQSKQHFLKTSENQNTLYYPIFENDKLKAIIILKNNKKPIPKSLVGIMDMLTSQISAFIDNYTYFYKLQNLNANLEETIEKRTQEIYKQKKELQEKNEELSEKIEELDISSKIIEDLNNELNENRKELARKNKALALAKKLVLKQKTILEENEQYIKQSINYAIKIQNVLYSDLYKLPIENSFICDSAKEYISGDLTVNYYKDNTWLLGVIDTTTSNVSSVFIRLLINSILDQIYLNKYEKSYSPSEIIQTLRYEFLKAFSMNSNESLISLQFEITLANIDFQRAEMSMSSTKFPIVIVRQGQIITLSADNFPIGDYMSSIDYKYELKKFALKKNDSIYLFTDGFYNQLNPSSKKYTRTRFYKLLADISNLKPEQQKQILKEKLTEWQGNFKRVDDFTIIGFKYDKE